MQSMCEDNRLLIGLILFLLLCGQAQRERLLHAAQLLAFGTYARAFQAWLDYARGQAAKAHIFAAKQAALQVCREQ